MTVNAVNDAPTITNVANQTIYEDGTTGSLAFTVNDQETAATSLTVTRSSSNTTLFPLANVVLGGSGATRTVTATPVANSSGTATITPAHALQERDPGLLLVPRRVGIHVDPAALVWHTAQSLETRVLQRRLKRRRVHPGQSQRHLVRGDRVHRG